jgi:hypothetical protein
VRRLELVARCFGYAIAAALVPRAFAPEAGLYRDLLTGPVLMRAGAVAKIFFLVVATLCAHRIASSFEARSPARLAWRLLGTGLLAFVAGQGYLAFFQIVLGRPSPYPSPADAGFVAGYPLLLAALWSFIHAYRKSGFPVGSARQHVVLAVAALALFLVIGAMTLAPALAAPAPPLEKLLNTAYPAFDFLLLVPLLILLRITLPFRGGRVWTVWAALLAGFASMSAGDILYAYFSTLGKTWLESILDALFVLSYLLLAQAAVRQWELVRS